ncbi:hypothetical protein SAMN05660330_03458 [Desulforhopalus singaporensis]|uniref:Uncharacterized protein n=1 Tax=Desulforhopalus singaporensis TaxID=91360 RepID=A0A1H0U9Y4_9BACT|nr:hypothetical protein SAMN05660330_03458 [Desulforhopalus singaporensis]
MILVGDEIDAKKHVLTGEKVWETVAGAEKIYVASGQKILEFDPADSDKDQLLQKITGRTGNLRAPALRIGNVFYIGFNTAMYENLG